jgi:mannose-1-phosphate guanylyltransferase
MKALLLAAGFGTRLRPLTDTVPKCLVPINGKPLLQIWLERLSDAGVDSFLINTHYLPEQVMEFINNSPFKKNIIPVHENELLGTAGTLRNNIDFFRGGDGMMIHADNFCLQDMTKFINAHLSRPEDCVLTIMAFRTEDPSSCGILETDQENRVIGFHEKVAFPPGNLANGAVYILSKELLDQLDVTCKGAENFSTDVLPLLIGKIFAFETHDVFMDIGTPENYQKANQLRVV